MNFLKRVLSTVVGIFVFFFIFIILLMVMAGVLAGLSSTDEVKIDNHTVLELHLDYPLLDNAGIVEFSDFPLFNQKSKDGLFDLVRAIKKATKDDHIEGISLSSPTTQAGITQLKTLRKALSDFKSSGKFVVAYSENYSQADYYLSSIADTLYLNPIGGVDLKGLATELLYFKDLEDKTGVQFKVFRAGKYKSAVEPFIDNKMSPANREQITSYLNSMWNNLAADIAESRNLPPEQIDSIANGLLARNAEGALQEGIIDKIAYRDEYKSDLKTLTGIDKDKDLKKVRLVKYAESVASDKTKTKDKIAVIYAQGQIYDNNGSVNRIAPDQMVPAIEKARKDDDIKAVVLRINSPGGSALASEIIWREIEITKKVKPVIVSMGDVAASGGYYIASGADHIFAEPTTITGSIGVFGLLPNFKGLTDKYGINSEQVKTHENSIFYSPFQEVSDNQAAFITEGIKKIYNTFKTRVADGRQISLDSVEQIAQGRVWTGEQALHNGLVDELGGLKEALSYAAEQAGIEDYQTQSFPRFKYDPSRLLRKYGLGIDVKTVVKEALGSDLYPVYQDVKKLLEYKGSEMILPYKTVIK